MVQKTGKDNIDLAIENSVGILGETAWYSVLHRPRFGKILRLIRENISGNTFERKTVLEIGSWPGYLSLALAGLGCKVSAIDIEPERLEKIKDPNLSFLKADINNIDGFPFPDDIFDAVVIAETIEHFGENKLLMVLAEAKRILKSGGIVVITTPNRSRLGNILRFWKRGKNIAEGPGWGHAKEYIVGELKNHLEQSGLDVKILKPDNFYSDVGKGAKDNYFYPLFSFLDYGNKLGNFAKIITIPITYIFPFFRDSIIVLAKK